MVTHLSDHDELDHEQDGDGEERRARKVGRTAIPDVVIRRLPIYARALQLLRAEGVEHLSSEELGDRIDVSAAQIRRDLAYFGDFGKQGKGYNVEYLLEQIKTILHLQHPRNIALVGVGDLGHALARNDAFCKNGFCITAVFDHNPRKQGTRVGSLTVESMEALPRRLGEDNIEIALLAVPAHAAQAVADQLVAGGIRAILNYAPTVVKVPRHVSIRHIDPIVALQSMTYYLLDEDE